MRLRWLVGGAMATLAVAGVVIALGRGGRRPPRARAKPVLAPRPESLPPPRALAPPVTSPDVSQLQGEQTPQSAPSPGVRASPWAWLSSPRSEVLAVLALTLLAAVPRLIALDTVPPGLHGDEGWMGIEARRILQDGPIGVWSPSALGQPAGPFYWTAAVFLLLEPSVATVRLSTALLGVLTVPAFYLFSRLLFGPRVALFGTALLAGGFWHIAYSRMAFPPVTEPLVASLSFAALFFALRKGRALLFLLAGAALGLGFYAYIPYPFLMLGVGAFILFWAADEARRTHALRSIVLRLGLLAGGTLAVAGPFLAFLLENPGPYTGYSRQTLVPFMPDLALGEKVTVLGTRLAQVAGHFFLSRPIDFSDAMGSQPLLDPLAGLLLLAGLAVALARWRDRRYLFLLLVLGAGLLPGVLSGANWGENRRIIGALPAVYLLAGLGLEQGRRLLAPRLARWPRALPLATIAVLLLGAAINLRTYARDFAPAPETRWVYAEEMARACEALAQEAGGRTVYFYSARWSYRYETCRFLAPWLQAEDRSREFGTFSLAKDAPGPVLYVLLPPYTDLAGELAALHPGGRRTDMREGDRLLFVTYEVG